MGASAWHARQPSNGNAATTPSESGLIYNVFFPEWVAKGSRSQGWGVGVGYVRLLELLISKVPSLRERICVSMEGDRQIHRVSSCAGAAFWEIRSFVRV